MISAVCVGCKKVLQASADYHGEPCIGECEECSHGNYDRFGDKAPRQLSVKEWQEATIAENVAKKGKKARRP